MFTINCSWYEVHPSIWDLFLPTWSIKEFWVHLAKTITSLSFCLFHNPIRLFVGGIVHCIQSWMHVFWTTVNDSVTFYSVPMPKAPIFYFSKKFNLLAVTFFFFFWLSFFYLITCFTHCRPPRFGEVKREPVLISRITWKMNLCCHAFSLLGTPYTMEISLHIMEDSICIYQILFVLREHRLSFDFQNWLLHAWLVTLDY